MATSLIQTIFALYILLQASPTAAHRVPRSITHNGDGPWDIGFFGKNLDGLPCDWLNTVPVLRDGNQVIQFSQGDCINVPAGVDAYAASTPKDLHPDRETAGWTILIFDAPDCPVGGSGGILRYKNDCVSMKAFDTNSNLRWRSYAVYRGCGPLAEKECFAAY